MKTNPNNQPIRRITLVLIAIVALPMIALAPAYLASLLTANSTIGDSDTSPHISATKQNETKVVETVLVVDPKADNDINDEFVTTIDPSEETEERPFTIVTDDSLADILGGSDLITITLDSESPDGNMGRNWIDSGCQIYMGSYDSQDASPTDSYTRYAGHVRVHDEEHRTSYDDCNLYWIDVTDDGNTR